MDRITLLTLLCACTLLAGCNRSSEPPSHAAKIPEAVPVRVSTVEKKDVQNWLGAVGRVEAHSSIRIKAQVSGLITKVWFKEGEEVHQGQILFSIESRPYEVALQQAEAELAKSKAELEQSRANLLRNTALFTNARAVLERNLNLQDQGVVALEAFDRVKSEAEALKAALEGNEAAIRISQANIEVASTTIEKTRIDLDYCTIRSPIDGRTGSFMVDPGNLVKANEDPPLVVINQLTPIQVVFSLPERELPAVQRSMREKTLQVEAFHPSAEIPSETGTLTFLDNSVDQDTGTIEMKATFANVDRHLWPGQFVNVRLITGVFSGVTVVPSEAVQTGQSGTYAYVVDSNGAVELRPVDSGEPQGGIAIVHAGLDPGEIVVTDGHLRLAPGIRVKVVPGLRGEEKT